MRPGDYVMFDVEGKVWAGDRMVIDSFTGHQPQGLPLRSGLPAWRHLAGQRVGSRVLEVVPPKDGFGRRGDSAVNVTGADTLVFVFDILAAVPGGAHASGTPQAYHPGPGLPRVTGSGHGPVITVPASAKPPSHLVTDVLIRGNGPPLLSGERPGSPEPTFATAGAKVIGSALLRKPGVAVLPTAIVNAPGRGVADSAVPGVGSAA